MKRFLLIFMCLFVALPLSLNVAFSADETEMGILLRDGHPTYYGSVEQSHEIWDDVKSKIRFGDTNKFATVKNPILYMDRDFKFKDLIEDVEIYFYNFENNPNFSLDDALPIAADYLPFDIIDQYYEYKGSFVKTDSSGNQFYTVSYWITKDAAEKYRAKEHPYSGNIDVIISVTDNVVQYIMIKSQNARWFRDKDDIEWNCDLRNYIANN